MRNGNCFRLTFRNQAQLDMNKQFWRGKRVLVTGHTGFKGSWLSLWLSALGAEVYGYALEPDTSPSLFALARVDELVSSDIGDIRNRQAVLCLLYTSPSPRDRQKSRMPSSA